MMANLETFDEIIEVVLEHEGGYVDDVSLRAAFGDIRAPLMFQILQFVSLACSLSTLQLQ